ncbi:MAG: glycosyltransferase family 1 protein [Bryobacteraceae bacterium]
MRIGINALYLIPGGVGGTEIYLRELIDAFARIDRFNEYVVFTNRETESTIVPARDNFTCSPQDVSASSRPARILFEQLILPASLSRLQIDVLFNPGFTSPLFTRIPRVTTFHDLQHKRHPEYFRWFDLPFWQMLLWLSAHASKGVIAPSEATRKDLLHYYRLDEDIIRVVSHGVEPEFLEIARARAAAPLPGKLLLCVSTLHPHKNLDRLVRAFQRFHGRHPDYELVIAGLRGFFAERLERAIELADLTKAVRLTGWIPREDLYGLYRDATAFVYPSRFEGFGMPVLEAIAAGLPLACSDIAPLKEVAADCAVYFPPEDDELMLDALERIVFDEPERARLAREGPDRAASFTWDRAARETLAVLERAVLSKKKG